MLFSIPYYDNRNMTSLTRHVPRQAHHRILIFRWRFRLLTYFLLGEQIEQSPKQEAILNQFSFSYSVHELLTKDTKRFNDMVLKLD